MDYINKAIIIDIDTPDYYLTKGLLSTAERRVKELDELIRKLYEGNATGKIPDKHFEKKMTNTSGLYWSRKASAKLR